MQAVLTLTRSMLRHRKLQNAFTALLLLLSALLLGTALTVLLNTGSLFENAHRESRGSQQILTLENGLHDPEFVHDWWSGRQGVQASKLLPYKSLAGLTHEGQDLSNVYLYMMDTPSPPFGVDELLFASGASDASSPVDTGSDIQSAEAESAVPARSAPRPGTVWIPTSLAYANGIQTGDRLGFRAEGRSFELEVAAIVVDVPYGAPFTTSARIWMNDGDYARELAGIEGGDRYMMGLRFDDYSRQAEYWESFEQALGSPYLESRMDFGEISAFYLILGRVIGFVMVFLGCVMMAIALITIGFTVSDALLTRYRTIGVLKSMGMTSADIMIAYLLQYGILALPALLIGLLLSRIPASVILGNTMSVLKTDSASFPLHGQGWLALAGLLLLLFVLLYTALYAGRTRSILPAQAIRYGMSERDSGGRTRRPDGGRVGFGRLPVGAVIAMRGVAGNRRGSVFIAIIALVSAAVLSFGLLLLTSISAIGQTSGQWGYDASDLAVRVVDRTAFERSGFSEALRSDSRIAAYGTYGDMPASLRPGASASPGTLPLNLYAGMLDGGYDELGYEVLDGRNPLNADEIALGVNAARYAGTTVGDRIELYARGEKYDFTVTGIYQSIANMSNSVRLTADALPGAYSPESPEASAVFVTLNDSAEAAAVAGEWNAVYAGALSAATQQSLIDSVFREVVRSLLPLGLMGALFLGVTALIIYSVCRIQIRKDSRTFGIYRSVGLTAGRLRRAVTLGTAVVACAGVAAGTLAGLYLLPLLLGRVLSGYGLVSLPLEISAPGTVAAALLSIAAAAAGCWISSRIVARTSPRILTVE
ncbi:FtsX-like permease family protein [Saccharibacillus sp. CPCC 101409]|uniref:ABC transporter permease n=1 Tax=Saccharibacillus sp. CPCC 101409 TaxID=3058041 RepID=UPI0026736842|nr:FtsX-like permease family protein [Saccharibacillus sp. CPCC 101409]MDO3408883.1 FtsX-like permease family protein [Saccharibacillus sp. CPCC 101409]